MKKEITITNITFGQKMIMNLFTWPMLLLCIYVSQGSTWWAFFTGVIFILALIGQAKKFAQDHQTVLKSKAEAIAWANSLPNDETS
jgi:hypothetical protein